MRMPIVLWILFICLCKSLHPNRKLKCSDHILYWHINTDTFNQLFFVVSKLPHFSFVSLKTELPWIIWKIRMLWTPCLVIPRITPLTLISTLPCISARKLAEKDAEISTFSSQALSTCKTDSKLWILIFKMICNSNEIEYQRQAFRLVLCNREQ